MSVCLVYITCESNDQASRIGGALVDERLAACVNIIAGMTSIYRWQGRLVHGDETVLIAKTRAELVPALTGRVKALHSYDCPCVVALAAADGNADFLDWIRDETRPPAG